jgi:AcrR family transcriptional regulator
MSKSGLYAHFRSKQELQLATIGTAREMFSAEVISPAEQAPTPLAKLELVCELFLSHLERKVFPGGCFFASAAAELDTHPGPVREQIAEFQRGWMKLLTELVREAQSAEELPAEDADQFAFELNSYLLMANTAFLLQNDPEWIERARTAVTARVSRR